MNEHPNIGFIGLGRMGYLMAGNIAKAGYPLTVYNRTRQKAEALAKEFDVTVASSLKELTKSSDIIISMLSDDEAVETTYLGPEGVFSVDVSQKILIDMSTISPSTVGKIYQKAKGHSADMLDAPVSGSTAAAETASLMIMVGGDKDIVAKVKGLFESMGSKTIHVGDSGSGSTMKLAVNSMIHSLNQALSEALLLSERAGIEVETAYEVIANSAVAAPVVQYRRPLFENLSAHPVSFALDLAKKDVRLALALAESFETDMPQAQTNYSMLESASKAGYGQEDMAAVFEYLRKS